MINNIKATLKKQSFHGAIYVENRNHFIADFQFGYQDIDHSIPITEKTLFNIASLSKMYTAVLLLQLVEKKQVGLNDTLNTWFRSNTFKDVTIEQLLSHTSGIPEYTGNKQIKNIEDILQIAEPDFLAGEGWFYSNTNYVLLAKIIEKETELSYEECLQKMIALPLDLHYTTTIPNYEYIAVGKLFDYRFNKFIPLKDDPIFKQIDMHDFYGDGGIYSTAKEIAQFLKGFIQGKLIPHKLLKLALTPSMFNKNYGYGFVIGEDSFGHTGSWPGYSAYCHYSINEEKLIVLLTNEEINPEYERQIVTYLHQPSSNSDEIFAPKHPKIIHLNDHKKMEGTYELVDEYKTRFTIRRAMDYFIISFENQHNTNLFKITPTLYWIRNTMSYINIDENMFIDEGIKIPFIKI